MISLDDRSALRRVDGRGMLRLIDSFPAHCRAGWSLGKAWVRNADWKAPSGVVLVGMGGSASAGDLVRGLLEDCLPVPMAVVRNYRLPAWVGTDTIVICSSYSGDTEETLCAFDQAMEVGARVLAITSGGALARRAAKAKLPVLRPKRGLPPRAALGYSLFGLLSLVEGWKLVPPLSGQVKEALEVLTECKYLWGAGVPLRENKAKQLASKVARGLPLIYAPDGPIGAAAFRWKTQLNENAKLAAYNCALPELDHNEIVGWKKPFGADHPVAVFLRDRRDSLGMKDRIAVTRRILKEAGMVVTEAWSRGRGAVARMASLVYLGDYVSAYAGILRGFDPTPIEAIEMLKRELRRRRIYENYRHNPSRG